MCRGMLIAVRGRERRRQQKSAARNSRGRRFQEQETTYTVGIGISQHIRMVRTTVNASMSVIRFIIYYCSGPEQAAVC